MIKVKLGTNTGRRDIIIDTNKPLIDTLDEQGITTDAKICVNAAEVNVTKTPNELGMIEGDYVTAIIKMNFNWR